MKECLLVGLGGALGAILRYSISMISVKSDIPLTTLCINIAGAILIGCIVGFYEQHALASDGLLLFLKTGLCGGFTTFSTFSLETLNLLEKQKYVLGASYALCSVILCILGVIFGRFLITTLLH